MDADGIEISMNEAWRDVELEVALDSGSQAHVCDEGDTPGYVFRITFFDDFHHFVMTFFFASLRNDTDLFYLSLFAPTLHTHIFWGRQRPALAF